jgi:flagella basal body P-ring formation protein FlgA
VVAETKVEVLQDGDAGERVLVRSRSSPAPLSARVVGPDLLEIDR